MAKSTFKPVSVAILVLDAQMLDATVNELQRTVDLADPSNTLNLRGDIGVLLSSGLRRHVAGVFAGVLKTPHQARVDLCTTFNVALDALAARGVFGARAEYDPRGDRSK